MSNANGVISTPLQLDKDLPEVLGVTKPGGGYDLGWYSANSHGQTNPWAKNKPFRLANVFFGVTDAQRKNANFGLYILAYTYTQASTMQMSPWQYLPPRGNSVSPDEPYRIDDWNGYKHFPGVPASFQFPNLDNRTEYFINELLASDLPVIYVLYKNDTGQTMGSSAEIAMSEINANNASISNISACLFCVRAMKGNVFYVANTEDTISCKFGTNINMNVINLSRYNITDAFEDDFSGTGYPDGAYEKRKLTLYPAINLYQPTALSMVRNKNGQPTSDNGYNGYYTQGTWPMLAVPEGRTLTIKAYKKNPMEGNYGYVNITQSSTSWTGSWGYQLISAPYTNPVQILGGKTLYFSSQRVAVQIIVGITNSERQALSMQVMYVEGSIFTKNGNVIMYDQDSPTVPISILTVPGNSTKQLIVTATYEAGYRSDYTFPSLTSPSYGTERLQVYVQLRGSSGWGATTALSQPGGLKELRWR